MSVYKVYDTTGKIECEYPESYMVDVVTNGYTIIRKEMKKDKPNGVLVKADKSPLLYKFVASFPPGYKVKLEDA